MLNFIDPTKPFLPFCFFNNFEGIELSKIIRASSHSSCNLIVKKLPFLLIVINFIVGHNSLNLLRRKADPVLSGRITVSRIGNQDEVIGNDRFKILAFDDFNALHSVWQKVDNGSPTTLCTIGIHGFEGGFSELWVYAESVLLIFDFEFLTVRAFAFSHSSFPFKA